MPDETGKRFRSGRGRRSRKQWIGELKDGVEQSVASHTDAGGVSHVRMDEPVAPILLHRNTPADMKMNANGDWEEYRESVALVETGGNR